jgi:hypothetical protein
LTEVEHYGFRLPNDVNFHLFEEELSANLLSDEEKVSLGTVARLHQAGNTLDALRLIFPLIEVTLNSALNKLSLPGSPQLSMRTKIDQLVAHGMLSPRFGNLTEIVVARNKSVHGNLDTRDDILDPLYVFVASVYRAMIDELRGKAVRPDV